MAIYVKKSIPVGALIVSALSCAHGQEKFASADVPKVEVKAEQEYDARREETVTKIIVNQQDLTKYGDTSLLDVLKRQPGITVSGGSGRNGAEIRMRGMAAGYVQILVDGQLAPAGFSPSALSPAQVERIEILRAATAELSTRSIAGTINIILKTKITASRELKLGADHSDSQNSGNATLLLSERSSGYAYMLNGIFQGGTNDQDSTEWQSGITPDGGAYAWHSERNVHPRTKTLTLTPRVIWPLGKGETLVSQSLLTLVRVAGPSRNEWFTEAGPQPLHVSEPDRVSLDSNTFRSDINWNRQTPQGTKLEARIGVSASDVDTAVTQQGYANGRVLALDREAHSAARELGLSTSGKYAASFAGGHVAAFGWDAGSSRIRSRNFQNDREIAGYPMLNFDESYTATLHRLALFGQDEFSLRKEWSLYLGARWEMLDTTVDGNTFHEIKNSARVLSPIIQSLWKIPDQKSQVRFALTRTYKAQGLASLVPRGSVSAHNSAVSPDLAGNPALKPELATGIDAAYEYFPAKASLFSVAVYSRKISDYTSADIVQRAGRWVQMPVNKGDARSHGVDLEAKFPLQFLNNSAPAIDFRASLSRNWSSVQSVDGGNNRMPSQIPLSANLGLDYKVSNTWTTGTNFSFKKGGMVQVSDHLEKFQSARRELDAYLLWVVSPAYKFRFSVTNALAQTAYAETKYENDATRMRSLIASPSDRLFRVILEAKL